MFKLVEVFWLVNIACYIQGTLIQEIDPKRICSEDIASFWCANNEYPYVGWQIRTTSGAHWTYNFPDTSNPTSTTSATLESSHIVARVVSKNESYMKSSVNIMVASRINGSTISCNNHRMTLTVPESTNFHLQFVNITLLSLQETTVTYNFKFTLNPPLTLMDQYSAIVSPPPMMGHSHVLTSSAAVFVLDKSIEYNIKLVAEDCPERFNTSFVIIGGYPNLQNFSYLSILQYFINESRNLLVLLKCSSRHGNNTHWVDMGVDGQESVTFTDICDNFNHLNSVPTSDVSRDEFTNIDVSRYEVTSTDLLRNEVPSKDCTTNNLIIVGTITGLVILFILALLLLVLCVLIIRRKNSKLNETIMERNYVTNETVTPLQSGPVYEELNLNEKTCADSPSKTVQNVMYEEFRLDSKGNTYQVSVNEPYEQMFSRT